MWLVVRVSTIKVLHGTGHIEQEEMVSASSTVLSQVLTHQEWVNLHLRKRLDDGTLPFKLCCFHNSSIRISFGSKRICWYKYTTYYLQSLL